MFLNKFTFKRIRVFWDVTLCQRFVNPDVHKNRSVSETSEILSQGKQRYIPKDLNSLKQCNENFKRRGRSHSLEYSRNFLSCAGAEESFVNRLQKNTPLIRTQYLSDAVHKLHQRPVFNITSLLCLRILFIFSNYNSVFIYHINTHFRLTQYFYYFFNAIHFDGNRLSPGVLYKTSKAR